MKNKNEIKLEEIKQDNKNIEPLDEDLLESLNNLRYLDDEVFKQALIRHPIKDDYREKFKNIEIIVNNEEE